MAPLLRRVGALLGRYLSRPLHLDSPSAPTDPTALARTLRQGDVLLVEGHSTFSVAIRYLTQSTWSHAALYVGDALGDEAAGRTDPRLVVEADVVEGVRAVPLSEFRGYHVRICRPVGLSAEELTRVVGHVTARLGHTYDLRNILDLARYLLPTPPVPQRWRRRLLALGSGDPTRAICSTLLAEAFQSVRYPILPIVEPTDPAACPGCAAEIHHVRHHSLFVPRDFDVSPYFEVVKPTLAAGFDPHRVVWAE